MKKLIYTATFTLAIAVSGIPAAQATGVPGDFKAPHVVHSGAHPNDAREQGATHHFELHVQGPALSQLLIDLPKRLRIKSSDNILVTDQLGEKVGATVSVNDRDATINFSQPVPPETTLSISIKGVRTPGYSNVWLYPIYGKSVGMRVGIPIGLIRIQTYPSS